MWLLWLISQSIPGVLGIAGVLGGVLGIAGALGRGTERARSADTGGCGPACLHARITTAMSGLSAIRNAIVVCPSGGRCHHEERECEQRRGGGGEFFRSRFHAVSFLFFMVPQKIPQRAIRAEPSRTAHLWAELRLAIAASASQLFPMSRSSLGVQTVMRSYEVVRVEAALRQSACRRRSDRMTLCRAHESLAERASAGTEGSRWDGHGAG